jgi:hypothetical protein
VKLATAIGLAAMLASAASARADSAKADEKFRLGKRLLAQKHYADACVAFEDSNRLDPGIGAELNVGHCYEEWGKFATAYRAYEAAAQMAKSQRDSRLSKIKERMDALDPEVPRLTVSVPSGTDTHGLVVTIDGDPLAVRDLGKEQRLDPGPHKIEYSVGDAKRSKLIPLERGGASDITLDVPKDSGAAAPDEKPDKATKTEGDGDGDGDKKKGDSDAEEHDHVRRVLVTPGHSRRVAGVVTMAAGGVAMGISGIVTISAHGHYKTALDTDCAGSTTMCDMAGLDETHHALHEANEATVVFAVGVAAVVTGIVLYATAPHGRAHEERDDAMLVPTVSSDGAGLAVLGRF